MSAATIVPQPESTIERRRGLSYDQFVREHMMPHKPVVIQGAVDHWPAAKWTPTMFKQRFGDKLVKVDREYRLDEYIDLIEASSPEKPAPYLFHWFIDEHFPELMNDFQPWPDYVNPNWLGTKFLPGNMGRRIVDHGRPGIFIGGLASTSARLHYDFMYHSYSFQLYGRKRFWLYPPEQSPFMYAEKENKCLSRVKNLEAPDLEQFPKFKEARALDFILEPSEFVFIPGGWWHATKLLGPSISITVTTANTSNWRHIVRELKTELRPTHPYLAGPYAAFLRGVGVWKGWRNRI